MKVKKQTETASKLGLCHSVKGDPPIGHPALLGPEIDHQR